MGKNFLKILIAGMLVVFLVACSDSDNDNSSNLKGKFIDSAVGGVKYKTATQNGETDNEGSFFYQKGEKVTFSIGPVTFPEVPAGEILTPYNFGTKEIATNIARFLQTLDKDGNPDNGIEIEATLHKALQAKNAAIQFTNTTEFETKFQEIAAACDIENPLVDAQTALKHLDESVENEESFKLSSIIGKTLYQHVKDGDKTGISTIEFKTNGELVLTEFGRIDTEKYRISGGILYIIDEEQKEEAHPAIEQTEKYVKFRDDHGTSTLYFSKTDAENSTEINDIGDGDENPSNHLPNLKFTKEWIAGRTLYNVFYEEDEKKWKIEPMEFSQDQFVFPESVTPPDTPVSISYTTPEGEIHFLHDKNEPKYIKAIRQNNERLDIFWSNIPGQNSGGVEYLYFDKAQAEAFIATNPSLETI